MSTSRKKKIRLIGLIIDLNKDFNYSITRNSPKKIDHYGICERFNSRFSIVSNPINFELKQICDFFTG